jgi:hypothetical protein
MENINIVEFIKKNPISKLSDIYNDKLLNKIKENFTNDEQKEFIIQFYKYLNNNKIDDFVIDLDDIWKFLDFNQKYKLKKILIKKFEENTDYIILQKPEKKQGSGGHNREIIMLNIITFQYLCIKIGTKKGDRIYDYFSKLEYILNQLFMEECVEISNKLESLENKNIEDEETYNHNCILDLFKNNNSLIYLLKVKTLNNNSFIIKINESKSNLNDDFNEYVKNYEECIILDCFPINENKEFEDYLHNHLEIKPYLCTTLKEHEHEKDLFFISNEGLSYKNLTYIIKDIIKSIHINNLYAQIEKLELEKENLSLKLEYQMKYSNEIYFKELIEQNKKLFEKIENL